MNETPTIRPFHCGAGCLGNDSSCDGAAIVFGNRLIRELAGVHSKVDRDVSEVGQPSPQGRLLLTIAEAAEALGVSRSTGYELVRGGELPVVRMGKLVRIPADALTAWVAKETRPWAD